MEEQSTQETAPERERRPVQWGRIVLLTPVFFLLPVLWALGLRMVGWEAFEFEGPSMEPTINANERFIVDKNAYGFWLPFSSEAVTSWGEPQLGDVVVVRSAEDDVDIVKRVVGVGGDTIEIRDNVIWRNGSAIETESLGSCGPTMPEGSESCVSTRERLADVEYVTASDALTPPSNHEPVAIPEGYVYAVGDHRDRSNDSRFFGPIPVNRVKGRALFIYWSANTDRILKWLS